MSRTGRWRIIEMEAWDKAFLDLVQPAYILFRDRDSEFAFGCVTGAFAAASDGDATHFDWDGTNEMDKASGDGWAELQGDGSIVGEITFHNGDDSTFIARRWETSSTPC